MFKLNNLTVKNFMSVGNSTQVVDFTKNNLTLVLGRNLDIEGDNEGARNGTGKTTILNALSYVLYGSAISNIKKPNLVNKTNNKQMLVTLDFSYGGKEYRLERGRKPNILKYFINNEEQEIDDFAQGDSRKTQEEIQRMLHLSHDMFKLILAFNTYTQPFLSMSAANQRSIIEQLLGITILSEKAEALKDEIKVIKDGIQEEEYRVSAIDQANKKMLDTISNLESRRDRWESDIKTEIEEIQSGIDELSHIDIKAELEAHKDLATWKEATALIAQFEKDFNAASREEQRTQKAEAVAAKNLKSAKDKKCPTCDQELHDKSHNSLIKELEQTYKDAEQAWKDACDAVTETADKLNNIDDPGEKPTVYYEDINDAHDHNTSISHLKSHLDMKKAETNPYIDQITELNTAIEEIDYTSLNDLNRMKDHQDFLLKLLTNKDSFVRKKIIDQNLAFLNHCLKSYITDIGLPHTVEFQNDLSVEITEFGRDFDFDSLSRGEQNRLILSLSWAFRDVWENLYQPINLLFIDELIDSGMDSIGVEHSISILKKIARSRKKNVWVISHKDDLVSRVNNVLTVTKENGFTSYSDET